jgi:hypothetical protein
MSSQANMDLLKRQRTFSIDETREQLRQGRPVQREAIISGAVDYQSLMFGDDHELAIKNNRKKSFDVPSSSSVSSSINMQCNSDNYTHTVSDAVTTGNESSFGVDTLQASLKHTETDTPSSPQRITPSTWAAMVKSSGESSSFSLTSPNRQSSLTKNHPQSSLSVSENSKQVKSAPSSTETKPSSKNYKENKEHIEKYKEKKPFHRSDRKKKYGDDHAKSSLSENVRFLITFLIIEMMLMYLFDK